MPSHPGSDEAPAGLAFAVLVTAAGTGERMGRRRKPYLDLAGKSILLRTLERLSAAGGCEQVVVVVHEEEHTAGEVARVLERELGPVRVVPGGTTRQASARAGLQAVGEDVPVVLIHDAVRPLVRPEVVRRVAAAALEHGAAIAAVPATETIKQVEPDGTIAVTPLRQRLWYARTPQGFRRELIVRAHREALGAGFEGTDDAQLVERLGLPVRVVEDSYDNIKITTDEDLAVAEALLRRQLEAPQPGGPESAGPRQTRRASS